LIIAAGSFQERVVSHGMYRSIIKSTSYFGSIAGNNLNQVAAKAALVINIFATFSFS
jgi:hypothetical protein